MVQQALRAFGQREADRARRAARDRQKAVEAEREKGEKEVVEISKAANNQMEVIKKINSDRVHALDENTQKNYQTLALRTSEDLKRLADLIQQARKKGK